MVGHLRFRVVFGFRVPGGALLGELLLGLQRIASPRAPMRMHVDELHARIWPISGGPYLGLSPNAGRAGDRASASARINRETHPAKRIPTPAESGSDAVTPRGPAWRTCAQPDRPRARALLAKARSAGVASSLPAMQMAARTLLGCECDGSCRRHLVRREFADELDCLCRG